jgi:hypothetical protein
LKAVALVPKLLLGNLLVLKLRFGFGFRRRGVPLDTARSIEAELQEKRLPSGAWEPGE